MINDKLALYKQIRKSLQLSLKLQLYFSMLENTLADNIKNLIFFSNKKFQQPIAQIFLKFSEQQKTDYLLQMITFIKSQSETSQESLLRQKTQEKSLSTLQEIISTIETSARMEHTKLKISYWNEVRFKFNKLQRTVQINSKKKTFKINLRLYLIRKSHNSEYCIVFQALKDDVASQFKILHFVFQKQIFNALWNQLYKMVIKSRKEQVLQMMKDEIESQNKLKEQSAQKIDKTLVFLSKKSISKYEKYRDSVIKRLQVGKFQFQVELQEELFQHPFIKSFKLLRSQRAPNLFKLEVILTRSSEIIKQEFIQNYKQKFRYILIEKILQKKDKFQAIYEQFILKNNKVHEVISIRECQNAQNPDEQKVLFVKGIQHIISKEYMEFIMGKVKRINPNECKLVIVGSFIVDQFFNVDIIIKYLLEFKDMLFRDKTRKLQDMDSLEEEEFFSICDELSYQDIQLEEGEGKCDESQDQQNKQINKIKQSSIINRVVINKKIEIQKKCKTINVLNAKHCINCLSKSDLYMKEHYLYKDWTRAKHGGVVCYNQTIISEQKKLFKRIITKMGSNLLKGNGILNLSLPVNVFKKQSQLTSIAKDFCFAPIFIEKGINSNSILERIKYASLLAISVGNLGISMEKPFNPIIGETMQCWIDNCPIYLEQISHHPPISAYYMLGRGYRIYGQIQSKISVGMNSAKGYSERPNYIIFQDGSKITMVYGKMLIKGMLFGERQFTFQEKIFVYDETNYLFSDILYGPSKKNRDPNDFICGKILKVKESFKSKFYANHQNYYPSSEDIQSELSTFQGIWTQIIRFDNKEYVNFKTDLPFDLINETHPLDSNSYYRIDLLKLIDNKVEQSQTYKENMEEDQRKDRKLRQNYTKKLK